MPTNVIRTIKPPSPASCEIRFTFEPSPGNYVTIFLQYRRTLYVDRIWRSSWQLTFVLLARSHARSEDVVVGQYGLHCGAAVGDVLPGPSRGTSETDHQGGCCNLYWPRGLPELYGRSHHIPEEACGGSRHS